MIPNGYRVVGMYKFKNIVNGNKEKLLTVNWLLILI